MAKSKLIGWLYTISDYTTFNGKHSHVSKFPGCYYKSNICQELSKIMGFTKSHFLKFLVVRDTIGSLVILHANQLSKAAFPSSPHNHVIFSLNLWAWGEN